MTKSPQAKETAAPADKSEKPSYEELLERAVRAEEKCLFYQTRLDETQRIARIGDWEWDIKNQHLYWSKETYNLFGLKPGPEDRNNYEAFITALHLHDLERVTESTRKALRHRELYALDFRIIRADNGKERILHSQADVVRSPDSGRPLRMIGTIQDVTSQRQSLQKLELLQCAINQANETIVITDRDANIIYANPAFERITGYSLEEVVGQNPRILQSGKTEPEVFKNMWQTLVAKKNWRGYFYNKRKNGSLYEEEVSISPLLDNERKISHYVAVKRDVSNENQLRRQLQQAQKMEAIGTLAGGIAHDFNNILTILIGNLELVMMFELEENHPAMKGLDKALAAGQRAKDLVNQILTFSHRQADDLQPLKTTPIIKEAVKLITASLPATIEINAIINATNDMVLAAPGPLHQVLINLCTNATHAMLNKGGKLEIKLANRNLDESISNRMPSLEPGEYIELKVGDTGSGIAPEIADKIFDPYFTTKPIGQGSGLGLATVQSIVQKLGGEILFESEVGRGSEFTVLLPALDYRTSITNSLTDITRLPTGSESLLLVDDEKDIVELNQQTLEKLGYYVSICSNGDAALKLIKRNLNQFDLVLTDMTMPGISGVQLAREIVKLNPEIAIIVGTGYSDTIDREEILAMGIKEFYHKPLSTDRLIRLIRKVLDEKNQSGKNDSRPRSPSGRS